MYYHTYIDMHIPAHAISTILLTAKTKTKTKTDKSKT